MEIKTKLKMKLLEIKKIDPTEIFYQFFYLNKKMNPNISKTKVVC